MEELTEKLKALLGTHICGTEIKGPAEINLLLAEHEDAVTLAAALKEHIAAVIDGSTLAKINLVSTSGKILDSFSLNQ